jgi:hypothetical protein
VTVRVDAAVSVPVVVVVVRLTVRFGGGVEGLGRRGGARCR